MENLELIAAILAAGVVAQKSSMSPEKAVDEAITRIASTHTEVQAQLPALEDRFMLDPQIYT
jgi:hypothetical protein